MPGKHFPNALKFFDHLPIAPVHERPSSAPRHHHPLSRPLCRLHRPRRQLHLAALDQAARGSDNLMPPLKAALADYVTIGECCRVLRGVFGEYHPREAA